MQTNEQTGGPADEQQANNLNSGAANAGGEQSLTDENLSGDEDTNSIEQDDDSVFDEESLNSGTTEEDNEIGGQTGSDASETLEADELNNESEFEKETDEDGDQVDEDENNVTGAGSE